MFRIHPRTMLKAALLPAALLMAAGASQAAFASQAAATASVTSDRMGCPGSSADEPMRLPELIRLR